MRLKISTLVLSQGENVAFHENVYDIYIVDSVFFKAFCFLEEGTGEGE